MKKYFMVLLILLVTGLVRVPWEKQLSTQLTTAGLLLPPPGETLREQMGQSATLAALGGIEVPGIDLHYLARSRSLADDGLGNRGTRLSDDHHYGAW